MKYFHDFGVVMVRHWYLAGDECLRTYRGRMFKISPMPETVDLDDYAFPREIRAEIDAGLGRCYFSPHFPGQSLPRFVRSEYVVKLVMRIYTRLCPKRPKTKISHVLKRRTWNLHVGESVGRTMCFCCKMTPITMLTFNCGHVVAECNGGETVAENLRPICQFCNSSMGAMDMMTYINRSS